MTQDLYSDARLYDLLFPAKEAAVDFYRAEADGKSERVLELGCGTGHKLIPIAADGHPSVGLDLSRDMLTEARRKADERGVSVEWQQGNMRDIDLGDEFDLIFIAANALLHLHEADDIVQCFRAVRRHLAPAGGSHSTSQPERTTAGFCRRDATPANLLHRSRPRRRPR